MAPVAGLAPRLVGVDHDVDPIADGFPHRLDDLQILARILEVEAKLDGAVTLREHLLNVLNTLLRRAHLGGRAIGGNPVRVAAPQACDRQAGNLPDEVPKGHLHAVDRSSKDLGVAEHRHQALDVCRILSDEVRSHETLDGNGGFEPRMRRTDSGQSIVGVDLDQYHEQVRLVPTTSPGRMKIALEREVDHPAGDPVDLHRRASALSSCADSSTDSSTGTKGSSYSMLIVPLKPWSRSKPTNRPHHSSSWPRPTVAKFKGISSGGFGHRLSSIPLSARRCWLIVVSLP